MAKDEECCGGKSCGCVGGNRSLAVEITFEVPKSIGLSQETLSQVTAVIYSKALDLTALVVEKELDSPEGYEVVEVDGVREWKGVGPGGLTLLLKILEVATGQPFVAVIDDDTQRYFQRKDWFEKCSAIFYQQSK